MDYVVTIDPSDVESVSSTAMSEGFGSLFIIPKRDGYTMVVVNIDHDEEPKGGFYVGQLKLS